MKYIGTEINNSWLLQGKKTMVIECVDEKNADLHIENIKAELNGKTLDYILLNHTSPDNVGSLEALLRAYPSAVVISSAAGIKNLAGILNREFEYEIAKDNKTLDLGGVNLLFKILPNLPWTDSMAAYLESEKALFCGSIFNDEDGYFENIISPYRNYARTAISRLRDLDIKTILPCFGNIITDTKKHFEEYSKTEEKDSYISLFYSSHFGYTREMAEAITAECRAAGIKILCFNADTGDKNEMKLALNQSDGFIIGTSTQNRNASQSIWNLITDIDMVNKKHTPCFVFGSCGWSGEGVYLVERFLRSVRMNVFEKPYIVNFKPSGTEIDNLRVYTKRFIKEIVSKGE